MNSEYLRSFGRDELNALLDLVTSAESLTFLGKVSNKSMAALSVEPPNGSYRASPYE